MALDKILDKQDRRIEAMTSVFETELSKMLSGAQARVLADLLDRLDIRRGRIAATSANRRVLREIDSMFSRELGRSGLQSLIDAYVEQFDGQFVVFQDVLKQTLGDEDAARVIMLDEDDKDYLALVKKDSADTLKAVVNRMAESVRKKTLVGIGAASSRDLANIIAEEVGRTPAQAKSEAATAISSFYRSLADVSFQKIEEDKNWEVRYRYVGPPASDPVIRPFCEHLMAQSAMGVTWTRDQIDDMDNEQLDNVFVTGGGYNCRHQWIIADLVKN